MKKGMLWYIYRWFGLSLVCHTNNIYSSLCCKFLSVNHDFLMTWVSMLVDSVTELRKIIIFPSFFHKFLVIFVCKLNSSFFLLPSMYFYSSFPVCSFLSQLPVVPSTLPVLLYSKCFFQSLPSSKELTRALHGSLRLTLKKVSPDASWCIYCIYPSY